jgi:hypothetical protein
MKMLVAVTALLLTATAASAAPGTCTQAAAEKSAILALTKALDGDVFESTVSLASADDRNYVLSVSFSKYHVDDSTGEEALIPCGLTVPVTKSGCQAKIQLDDNMMCFQ